MFEYTKKKTIVNKIFYYGIRWVGTIPFIYSRNVKFFCRGIKFEINDKLLHLKNHLNQSRLILSFIHLNVFISTTFIYRFFPSLVEKV